MSNQIENYDAHKNAHNGRDGMEHNISRQITDFLGCNSCYPNTNGGQRRDLRGPRSVVGGLAEWQSAPVDDCMHSCSSCAIPGAPGTRVCQNASERHLEKGPCYSSAESRLFRPGISGDYFRETLMQPVVDTTHLM